MHWYLRQNLSRENLRTLTRVNILRPELVENRVVFSQKYLWLVFGNDFIRLTTIISSRSTDSMREYSLNIYHTQSSSWLLIPVRYYSGGWAITAAVAKFILRTMNMQMIYPKMVINMAHVNRNQRIGKRSVLRIPPHTAVSLIILST